MRECKLRLARGPLVSKWHEAAKLMFHPWSLYCKFMPVLDHLSCHLSTTVRCTHRFYCNMLRLAGYTKEVHYTYFIQITLVDSRSVPTTLTTSQMQTNSTACNVRLQSQLQFPSLLEIQKYALPSQHMTRLTWKYTWASEATVLQRNSSKMKSPISIAIKSGLKNFGNERHPSIQLQKQREVIQTPNRAI